MVLILLNTDPIVGVASIPKCMSACPIRCVYHIVCINYLFLFRLSITSPFTSTWEVVTENLARTIGFTMYPGVYYLTIRAEVLTRTAIPVPGVRKILLSLVTLIIQTDNCWCLRRILLNPETLATRTQFLSPQKYFLEQGTLLKSSRSKSSRIVTRSKKVSKERRQKSMFENVVDPCGFGHQI